MTLDPIVVNEYGERFREPDGMLETSDPKVTFVDLLEKPFIHCYCEGFVQRNVVSAKHAAYTCTRCSLRVVVPLTCNTWEKFQTFLKSRGIG